VALCDGATIGLEDLPEAVVQATRTESLRDAVRSGQLGSKRRPRASSRSCCARPSSAASGNQTRAAEVLGITRRVLKLKIDRYGLAERG